LTHQSWRAERNTRAVKSPTIDRQKREIGVSELIVFIFTDRYRAPEVLNELRRRNGPLASDLESAIAIVLDNKANASVHMNVDLSRREPLAWAKIWGALLKSALFVPLADSMTAAVDRILCPSVEDECSPAHPGEECNEIKWWREVFVSSGNFPRDVSALVSANSSAILMLLRNITPADALIHLRNYGNTIMHTSISAEQDQKLSELLEGGDS
jgi:uncharacterized membrane protein